MHTRPERRAGRHRPFWHGAAGCAAGCVKARGLSSACPRFVVFRPVPGGRARRDSDRSTVGSTSTTSWKDLSRRLHHLPESVNLFCDGDHSRRVSCVTHPCERCPLTWDNSDRGCECLHNLGSENGLFASITARKSHDNCAKQVESVLTCLFPEIGGASGLHHVDAPAGCKRGSDQWVQGVAASVAVGRRDSVHRFRGRATPVDSVRSGTRNGTSRKTMLGSSRPASRTTAADLSTSRPFY